MLVVGAAWMMGAPPISVPAPSTVPAPTNPSDLDDGPVPLQILSERDVLTPVRPVESITFGEIVAFAGDEALVTGAVVGRPGTDSAQIATFERRGGEWMPRTSFVTIGGVDRRDAALRRVAAGPAVIAASFQKAATNRGAVLILSRDLAESGWTVVDRLEPSTPDGASEFGGVLATDGALLAVSEVDPGLAMIASTPRTASPRVHLFERHADGWKRAGEIDTKRAWTAPWFGAALAIDRSRLVIGSPQIRSSASDDAVPRAPNGRDTVMAPAHVSIHQRGTDGWAIESTLLGSQVTPWPGFGTEVAVEADLLAVRATEDGDDGRGSKVFIFRRSGDTWRPEGELVPRNSIPGASFGSALAISRGRVLVGDTHATIPGREQTGVVHGFERVGEHWIETVRLIPKAPAMLTSFGSHLAVQGDTVIVNRTRSEARGCPWGGAYLYELPAPIASQR